MKLSKGETSRQKEIMENTLLSKSLPTSTPLEEDGATEGAQAEPKETQAVQR